MTTADARRVKYELVPGEALGKYEILRKLAVGGMAEIYLSRIRGNAGFEKVVVLKRILPQVAEDPTFVQMFLEEARLAATLNHPNIAHVYDVGEVDGQHFFTMEFVHGQDVRTIRHELKKRNENVPIAISLAVIHGVAAALDYAHERVGPDGKLLNLVHRDVSASNVMVSYDGAIKLLDFGIARAATSAHKTQVGTLKGKVPYMSPEQCKGYPLDRRSDLFSLGVVLFEMTVGRRPFRGDSDFAIMDQIVNKGAPRPSSIQPDYPPALEAIVMKLLERDPKARYTTGEELGEELDAFIQGNGMWVSPTKLGKYMRSVFADRIKAWEDAEQQGVTFAQHVAHSITSQSQKSELVTPPSAFPGLPSKSREMAAVAPSRISEPMTAQRSSEVMAAQRISEPTIPGPKMPLVAPPSAPVAVPQLVIPTGPTSQQHAIPAGPASQQYAIPAGPTSQQYAIPAGPASQQLASVAPSLDTGSALAYATLRPKSHRVIFIALVGLLVAGAGIAGFTMMGSSSSSSSAAGSADEVHATSVESTPAKAAPDPKPTVPETKPTAKPTVPETKPTVPETKPTVPETKPTVPETRPTVRETKPPTKPTVTTKPVTPTKPAETKQVIRKPKPDKPKEQTWDPNSPFLPQ